MLTIRRSEDRGHARYDWLDTKHSFSFGNYFDPRHMGFGPLRVINEDIVAPGGGFPTHGHANMEIITYILEGALEHKDSLGTGSVIRPGDVQRMSAGTGIRHSEFNASKSEPVHLLQIWIEPDTDGVAPGYEQTAIDPGAGPGGFRLIASRDGREGSVRIHQDADVHVIRLGPGGKAAHTLREGRIAWLQVARGSVRAGGETLRAGDGAAIEREREIAVEGAGEAEVLLFDMAA